MRTIVLPLLCLLTTSALLPAAEKLQLRPHWEVGKVYRQENSTDIEMAVPGLAESGGQNTIITQTLTVTVKKAPGSENKLAEVKFAAIKGTVNMLGQVMTYDSNDPAKSQPFLQQTFGALLGKSFTLMYDKDDKFLEARGLDAIATPLGQGKAMDGNQLADAFRKSQDMALPKEPASIGDTWTFDDKIEMPPVGSIGIKTRGKFESIVVVDGRKHAKLTLEGSFESPGGAAQLVQFGAGSKFSGEVLFDLDRKVVSSTITRTDLKLTIGGKEMPVKQTATMKLTAIEEAK